MGWTRIDFEIQTPMFLGGADPSSAEFRIPSLRGALRFWFRALAGAFVQDDPAEVAELERALFGSPESPSALQLRPGESPVPSSAGRASWINNVGVRYLLGPGLYRGGLTRRFLDSGARGWFKVNPDRYPALVGCLLWILSNFGGLGSRVRRGFGRLAFQGLEQLWPEVCREPEADEPEEIADWIADSLERCMDVFSSTFGHSRRVEIINSGSCVSVARPRCGAALPRFASFSCWRARVSQRQGNDFGDVLDGVGRALREHRAPPPRGLTPEYDTIVVPWTVGDFKLAAFGLPVPFPQADAKVTVFSGEEELRRASPLWISPFRIGRHWHVLYHVFRAELWGVRHALEMDDGRRRLRLDPPTARDPWPRLRRWMRQAP